MARARNIKPDFFKNDVLAQCAPHTRLLFAGLWCLADREGRLQDRPFRIKGELFPYEDVKVNDLLDELSRNNFIDRYKAGGLNLIQIRAFKDHQKPHPNEAPSELPELVVNALEKVVSDSDNARSHRADCLLSDSPSLIPSSLSRPTPLADRFPEFWKAYPKKVKKKGALKIWKSRKLDSLADTILADIQTRLAEDARWRKDGGAYIPDPTTYLNQDRWEDEITAPQQRKRA